MSDSVRHYSVYGDCLASTMEFPELHELAPREASWRFDTVASLPPMTRAIELGADLLYDDVHARLYAHGAGHRIIVDDTGAFELSADRQQVTWERTERAWPDFVRAHLLGRVLATAMYLEGMLPLHASAVLTEHGVIAFLAPKGFGKSTLALALASRGAPLATDDTLPLTTGASPLAWPGVHALRVHDDAIAAVGASVPSESTREGKRLLTGGRTLRRLERPAPLAALYLIDPVRPEAGATTREPLPPLLAAIGVVAHVKIGRMLGPSAAAPMLERAAAIARAQPVFRLSLPRDLTLLGASAETLLGWHGGIPA